LVDSEEIIGTVTRDDALGATRIKFPTDSCEDGNERSTDGMRDAAIDGYRRRPPSVWLGCTDEFATRRKGDLSSRHRFSPRHERPLSRTEDDSLRAYKLRGDKGNNRGIKATAQKDANG
jgi:hypothetical protein